MVSVPLIELVCVPGGKRVWPEEFRAFVEMIEADPDEPSNYTVAADWLHDQGEVWLEKAFRYFAKNESLTMRNDRYSGWAITLPPWLHNVEHGAGYASDTPAGVLADLGFRLKKLAEELE